MLHGHAASSGSSSSGGGDEWDELVSRVHWPMGMVLFSEYSDALRALGLVDPAEQRLGRGGFGYAYKTKLQGFQSVLKFTRDPYEVIAAWSLRSKKTSHIVPVYDMWCLPKLQQHEHWASWWVVHRGYLKPLTKKDFELIELLYDLWSDEDLKLSVPKIGAAGRSMREKWRIYIREESDLNPQESKRSMVMLDQISSGIREMGQHGIEWTDIIPENLLMGDDGTIKIADIGFGRNKRDVEVDPPELTVQLARAYARVA